jgi:membrane protease YdiL (CAAX protease family)
MPLFAKLPADVLIPAAAILLLTACVDAWVWIAARWRRGQPVLPYQPRRPVPWGGLDLIFIVAFYLVFQAGVWGVAGLVLGPAALQPPDSYNVEEAGTEHEVVRLMEQGGPWVILLCVVSVVVIAPLVEEFLFRLLFQGWLEAIERRWRRQMPTLRRLLPRGSLPVFLSTVVFARMHFRVDGPPVNPRFLAFALVGGMLAELATVIFAIGVLRWRGATAADFGWAPAKLRGDAATGLLAFCAAAAPIYTLQWLLSRLLPPYLAPDPFTLFFFALLLGTLYYRRHRIAPGVVAHAALNAASVLPWLL